MLVEFPPFVQENVTVISREEPVAFLGILMLTGESPAADEGEIKMPSVAQEAVHAPDAEMLALTVSPSGFAMAVAGLTEIDGVSSFLQATKARMMAANVMILFIFVRKFIWFKVQI